MSILQNTRIFVNISKIINISTLRVIQQSRVPVKNVSATLFRLVTTLPNSNRQENFSSDYVPTPDKSLISKDNLTPNNIEEVNQMIIGSEKNVKIPLEAAFNLSAFVNKSATLQKFVQLGVDLHSIERRKGLAQFVLNLDFENVKPYLMFLQNQGISPDMFGDIITKNPLLFKVDLDNLQIRVNYLESKRFTKTQIQRIISVNPFWLMFPAQRINNRLGYFQENFHLSGDDVRFLTTKQPRLITYNMDHIKKSTFCIREEMGFHKDEVKVLLLAKPRLWMMNSDVLIERFAYAHKDMQLSHDILLQFPEIFTSREFRLRERHEFLKMLGRAQYDPTKDLYISPKAIVEGNNYYFATKVAKSHVKTYELFLKSR